LIAAKIVSVLHDRPYYRSDIVTAQPSDETVRKAAAQGIPVAATEESLREFADAITDPGWASALIKGQAVFLVPGGTRFAILRVMDPKSWTRIRPFLRWSAALKMEERQCHERVRITRPA
jgi:hypothetical protein